MQNSSSSTRADVKYGGPDSPRPVSGIKLLCLSNSVSSRSHSRPFDLAGQSVSQQIISTLLHVEQPVWEIGECNSHGQPAAILN